MPSIRFLFTVIGFRSNQQVAVARQQYELLNNFLAGTSKDDSIHHRADTRMHEVSLAASVLLFTRLRQRFSPRRRQAARIWIGVCLRSVQSLW